MCWDDHMSHAVRPTLEMLWETQDPEQTLQERFGFTDAGSAGQYPHANALDRPRSRRRAFADRVAELITSAGERAPELVTETLEPNAADTRTDGSPPQLVHGDFRSANILCHGSDVLAIIDFEEARIDHCVDELARSAVLLGTRFHDWGPVSPRVHATFLAGYQSVRQLSPVELEWWHPLILGYTLAFIPADDDPHGWRASALELTRRGARPS
ncbi:phosphotransferase enzyme family protein [Propionibacteriaceae bacterium Y1685]